MTIMKYQLLFLALCSFYIRGMELNEQPESKKITLKQKLKMLRDPEEQKIVSTLMRENPYYPIYFAGKTLYLDQISTLDKDQRAILYKNVFPSCLMRCFGGPDVMYEQNIKEFKEKMPAHFIKDMKIQARTEMCCTGFYAYYGASVGAMPAIGGLIALACDPTHPLALSTLGLSCGISVALEAGVLITAKLSPFCCYLYKDYTFDVVDSKSDLELLDSSDENSESKK